MSLLLVNSAFFSEAAAVIVAERKRAGDTNLNSEQIEQVVRTYVQLGIEGKNLVDWSWKLSEEQKSDIIKKIIPRTLKDYRFDPAFNKVWTNLDIIETQAALGKVNPIIARPRAAQLDWEKKEAYSHESSAGGAADTSLQAAFNRVFGGIGKTVGEAFKGLGLNINLMMFIIVCILIVKFALDKK